MPNFRSGSSRVAVSENGILKVATLRNLNMIGATVADAGGGQADVTVAGGGALYNQWKAAVNFSFSDVSPINLYLAQLGERVVTIQIVVTEVFDGINPSLSVGDIGDTSRLMTAQQCDLTQLGEDESNPGYQYAVNTQTIITLNPGAGATQGRATALIQIE